MQKIQTSETMRVGAVLTIAGGFMDAYSYIGRGKVFSNAQTGNILLFGVYLSEGKWSLAIRYSIPVFAFFVGIVLAEVVRYRFERKETTRAVFLHWRQVTLLLEMLSLTVVCFLPQSWNLIANSITSMACGMQVESFRKIYGNGIATTMCIGNLRSGTECMCKYFYTKKSTYLRKTVLYYGIIGCFVIGAILGNIGVKAMQENSIMICVVLLLLAFTMMFQEKRER